MQHTKGRGIGLTTDPVQDRGQAGPALPQPDLHHPSTHPASTIQHRSLARPFAIISHYVPPHEVVLVHKLAYGRGSNLSNSNDPHQRTGGGRECACAQAVLAGLDVTRPATRVENCAVTAFTLLLPRQRTTEVAQSRGVALGNWGRAACWELSVGSLKPLCRGKQARSKTRHRDLLGNSGALQVLETCAHDVDRLSQSHLLPAPAPC